MAIPVEMKKEAQMARMKKRSGYSQAKKKDPGELEQRFRIIAKRHVPEEVARGEVLRYDEGMNHRMRSSALTALRESGSVKMDPKQVRVYTLFSRKLAEGGRLSSADLRRLGLVKQDIDAVHEIVHKNIHPSIRKTVEGMRRAINGNIEERRRLDALADSNRSLLVALQTASRTFKTK